MTEPTDRAANAQGWLDWIGTQPSGVRRKLLGLCLSEGELASLVESRGLEMSPSELGSLARRRWALVEAVIRLPAPTLDENEWPQQFRRSFQILLDQLAAEPTSRLMSAAEDDQEASLHASLIGWQSLTLTSADGKQEELNWRYRGVLEVLSFLLTSEQRTAGRDELLLSIWPDLETDEARRQFYPAVSHLRRLLKRAGGTQGIVASKGRYSIEADLRLSSDVEQVRSALRSTDFIEDSLLDAIGAGEVAEESAELTRAIETLEAAWRCVRGPFLQGTTNEWIAETRRNVDRQHATVLRRLACALGRSGRDQEAEDVLRTLLTHDRLQEDAYVALMRLFVARGRSDLARRQYERMSSILWDEARLQPMDTTVREVERLLS